MPITVFFGWSDLTSVRATAKPFASRDEFALSKLEPITLGTATGFGPLETRTVTVDPCCTDAPLVVVVVRGRWRVRHRLSRALRDLGDRGGRRTGNDCGRRLFGRRRHRGATGNAGEVGVHLLGALVPVSGVLRQRAQDDEIELAGNL